MRKLGKCLGLIAVVAALAIASTPTGALAQGAGCQFILGFKALHNLDPQDVGACVDDRGLRSQTGTRSNTRRTA